MAEEWKLAETAPENVVVAGTIKYGLGMTQPIKMKRIGAQWFLPNGNTIVRHPPTHWRETEVFTPAPALEREALTALCDLTRYALRNTCTHENTHRGGYLWTICGDCGAKWADDRGGKPEWHEPREIAAALDVLKRAGIAV